MAVVVDDLLAWLVGLLGEAGRRGLVRLVLGSDLERALLTVMDAAVTGTAAELRPRDDLAAEHLAAVIAQVAQARVPRELDLAAGQSLWQAISAGVSEQVAVLDDPGLTGLNVSSADVLGIPGRDIAESLARHLVAGITTAGLGGGPLKPLADQLNHDLTHAQGQTVLDRLAAPATTATGQEFAADLRGLLEALAGQAGHGRLPSYLHGRRDIRGLTRAVSVRAGTRKAARPGGHRQEAEEHLGDGRAYALAADRDDRDSETVPWPRVAAEHDRVVVLADPGLGKSWLIRTETLRLAAAALGAR